LNLFFSLTDGSHYEQHHAEDQATERILTKREGLSNGGSVGEKRFFLFIYLRVELVVVPVKKKMKKIYPKGDVVGANYNCD